MAALGLFVAGCSSPSHSPSASSQSTGLNQQTQSTPTTKAPPGVTATVPTSPTCSSGTVTVNANADGQPTSTCVQVGSDIVMTGGSAMSGGTWPGPPRISDGQVVKVLSSSHSGVRFTATLEAIGAGSASVTVPFVPGESACSPTPCTPVPGAPLDLEVTVVGLRQ